ncbi:MAG: ABC transporter [Myxococcales bacterium]
MAGASLLTLIDDIASILDDVAVMTKVAAKKTSAVLGDDLALNAQQLTGLAAQRELPVVWAVAKGSAVNKVILVPLALAISAFVPSLILPLLMIGGAYLCFEGAEKIIHKLLHQEENREHLLEGSAERDADPAELERQKIKGAVRTDFILSAEIIVIALGSAADATFGVQVGVLTVIAAAMTVGVYGLVAGIVKLDDAGLHLSQQPSAALQGLGRALLVAAPVFMKILGIVGTAAMFLVGGGIVVHGVPALDALMHDWTDAAGAAGFLVSPAVNGLAGVAVGGALVALVTLGQRIRAGRGPSGA